MAKRPRIQTKTIDEQIVDKHRELNNCTNKEAWTIHSRRMTCMLRVA